MIPTKPTGHVQVFFFTASQTHQRLKTVPTSSSQLMGYPRTVNAIVSIEKNESIDSRKSLRVSLHSVYSTLYKSCQGQLQKHAPILGSVSGSDLFYY